MLRVVNNKIPVSYICVNFFNILIQYLQQFLFCSQKKKKPRSTFTRISYIEYSRHIRKWTAVS